MSHIRTRRIIDDSGAVEVPSSTALSFLSSSENR